MKFKDKLSGSYYGKEDLKKYHNAFPQSIGLLTTNVALTYENILCLNNNLLELLFLLPYNLMSNNIKGTS